MRDRCLRSAGNDGTGTREGASKHSSWTSTINAVEDGSADLVLIILSAHEIRDRRERERLFHESARMLADSGRIVLVEHLRDVAAALAFGPGLFHFYPRSIWLKQVASARLAIRDELAITPFVRVFVLERV